MLKYLWILLVSTEPEREVMNFYTLSIIRMEKNNRILQMERTLEII